MKRDCALRPTTSRLALRCRRGASALLRVAWQLVLAAAPAVNLYWTVGLPPYGDR